MKKKTVSTIFLGLITLLSMLININNTITGGYSTANTLITLLYIVYWSVYVLLSKHGKSNIITVIWSGATLITAIIGLVVIVKHLDGGFLILPVLVFLTPFYGLSNVVSKNGAVVYSITIIISAIWLVYSVYKYIKRKR